MGYLGDYDLGKDYGMGKPDKETPDYFGGREKRNFDTPRNSERSYLGEHDLQKEFQGAFTSANTNVAEKNSTAACLRLYLNALKYSKSAYLCLEQTKTGEWEWVVGISLAGGNITIGGGGGVSGGAGLYLGPAIGTTSGDVSLSCSLPAKVGVSPFFKTDRNGQSGEIGVSFGAEVGPPCKIEVDGSLYLRMKLGPRGKEQSAETPFNELLFPRKP